MKKREFYVLIEETDDGTLVGMVPGLHGAHSYGRDFKELMVHMKEVIELCLEDLHETGKTEKESEFVGIQKIEV